MLQQKLRLLAFLVLPPVTCLNGVPVHFPKLRQITMIFKISGARIRLGC